MHPFCAFGKDCILQSCSILSRVPLGPLVYVGLVAHRLCYRLHRVFVCLFVFSWAPSTGKTDTSHILFPWFLWNLMLFFLYTQRAIWSTLKQAKVSRWFLAKFLWVSFFFSNKTWTNLSHTILFSENRRTGNPSVFLDVVTDAVLLSSISLNSAHGWPILHLYLIFI